MQLQEALSQIQMCRIPVLDDYSKLQKLEKKEFYYSPPFKQTQQDEKSTFILFSAPGAVGKTSLARHIAFTYGGLYWDVSSEPIGGASFAGVIAHAAGIGSGGAKLDSIIQDMKRGKALFVLDAFDEAALISKREGIRAFLLEIGHILADAESPSVVLTARTETAQFIRSVCAEAGFRLTCYDIDYFEEEDAPHFVEEYLKSVKIEITPSLRCQIRQYINIVKQRLDNNEDIRSFIGYAQVLAILSRQIEEEYLLSHTLEGLYKFEKAYKGRTLIYDIIQELISRETKKLCSFKASIRQKYARLGREHIVDNLYGKQEQLVRLQFLILSDGAISLDDYAACSELLPDDQTTYFDLLKEWLPQHVFLLNGKIMPIFYDYLLAESLLDPELELFVDEYKSKLPTRVFMDCYLSLNHNCVNSEHVYYLDLAYSSQATTGDKAYCEIAPGDEDSEVSGTEPLTLYLTLTNSHHMKENSISVEIIRREDAPICLSRAENISVNVDGRVILEQSFLSDVTIRQATIECDQLALNANEIIFESYNDEESTIIVHESVTRSPNSKIRLKGTSKLKVDFPVSDMEQYRKQFYELLPYFYSFDSRETYGECDSIDDFVYALKKVLEQFKIDSYGGDPAKHKEKIDARCHTGSKANVLAFLKDIHLIYEDGILYKASLQHMEKLQISRVAYTHLRHDQLKLVYEKYRQWFLQK